MNQYKLPQTLKIGSFLCLQSSSQCLFCLISYLPIEICDAITNVCCKWQEFEYFYSIQKRSQPKAYCNWRWLWWNKVWNKLRQLNPPRVKFGLKSDSNHLLIHIFDPNSSSDFTSSRPIWLESVLIISNHSKYIENWSDLIKNRLK